MRIAALSFLILLFTSSIARTQPRSASVSEPRSSEPVTLQPFAKALNELKQKDWSDAKADLTTALKQDPILSAEIDEKMAEADDQGGAATKPTDLQNALNDLQKTLDVNPNWIVATQARFLMSKIELKLGKLHRALLNLRYLELRSRRSPQYPDILVTLLKVELKEKRSYLACRWARILFARFPAHSSVSSWGVDLVEDKIGHVKVDCVPSYRDIKTRMQRLQLVGHANKAKHEIDQLRAEAKATGDDHDRMQADMLLVQYYEMQGYPDEALQILVKYYDQKKTDLKYQEHLGRLAAQAGEFQSAIGAFTKAYHLSPRSREGRSAGFNAAYLSYQIQDYDGAEQRFTKLIKRDPGSWWAKQARWQLAWIQYLKSHYKKAEGAFRKLYSQRIVYRHWWHHRLHWWVRYPYRDDRTRYWLAMSLFRQKKYIPAKKLLKRLVNEPGLSFYGFLAKDRLKQIPSEQLLARTDSKGAPSIVAPQADDPPSTTTVDGSIADDAGPHLTADADVASDIEPDDETVEVTAFKDPQLRIRFKRASELMKLGLSDWAKGELYEIERRTRNKTYLKMLMAAYIQAGSYDLASRIAQDGIFEHDRQKDGLKGAASLWQFAFPRAYGKYVKKYCLQFGVPERLVWAIMRAESHFNPNAISAVGARGLVQLMPYTANQLEKLMNQSPITATQLITPQTNVKLGTRYLARLLRQFSGYVPLVAAAYNAGPQRVYSWLHTFGNLNMDEFVEHIPFVETRNYVKEVVRNYIVYSELYAKKSKIVAHQKWLTSTIPVKIDRKPSPRENWESIE